MFKSKAIQIPIKFNMLVNLSPDRLTSAEIVTLNGFPIKTIEVNNDSIINFYKINSGSVQKSIAVLLKTPEVRVIRFKQSNFDPYFINTHIPLNYEGAKNQTYFVGYYKESVLYYPT